MREEIKEICKALGVEVYVAPEIDTVVFEAEDVITTSGLIETPVIPIKPRNVW